jgi:hypothetical protein
MLCLRKLNVEKSNRTSGHSLSTADVRLNMFDKRYDITVTLQQLAVILVFNDEKTLTWKEVKGLTKFGDAELARLIKVSKIFALKFEDDIWFCRQRKRLAERCLLFVHEFFCPVNYSLTWIVDC